MRGHRAIAVNQVAEHAPWADVLFWYDAHWYRRERKRLTEFGGLRVSVSAEMVKFPEVHVVDYVNRPGVSDDPDYLCWNGNSGASAINLAYLLGARRIVLVGFDMHRVWACQRCDREWREEPDEKRCPDCGGAVRPKHNYHRRYEEAGETSRRRDDFDPYGTYLNAFPQIAADLHALGCECVNATSGSALRVFPAVELDEVI